MPDPFSTAEQDLVPDEHDDRPEPASHLNGNGLARTGPVEGGQADDSQGPDDTATEATAGEASADDDTAGDDTATEGAGGSEPAGAEAQGGGPAIDGATFGAYYYGHDCGLPYERSPHWNQFFAGIAERIVRELHPVTVLDAGCAIGLLVEQLRNRGVDAYGVDISQYAHDQMPDDVRQHCRVASLTEPLDRRYDLITCIEVVEHMPAADGRVALDNLCAATDRLLLSTSPFDYSEPTHLNVQPPEHWSAILAGNGFVRDIDYDASYLTPWAALYVRSDAPLPEVVRDYDRSWWRLRYEVHEVRSKVLELQTQLEQVVGEGEARSKVDALQEEADRLRAETMAAQEEALRLRDELVGKEAELGTAQGRIAELSSMLHRYENVAGRLDEVLQSKSWRLMWAAGTPVRIFRERNKGS